MLSGHLEKVRGVYGSDGDDLRGRLSVLGNLFDDLSSRPIICGGLSGFSGLEKVGARMRATLLLGVV
jgi:hypothetical protein